MADEWRLIEYERCSAPYNMALDEALARTVTKGDSAPTLRLYGWSVASVSLGAFQRGQDINRHNCLLHHIPVVRRPTGGRAIVHGEELTYSFSSPVLPPLFTPSILENYKTLNSAFLRAFRSLSIDASIATRRLKRPELSGSPLCFASTSFSEITVKGKKIMGSAQKRFDKGFLQQGSIPLATDSALAPLVFQDLSTSSANPSGADGNPESAISAITGLCEAVGLDKLISAVCSAFESHFGIRLTPGPVTRQEEELARLLVDRYQSSQWTFRR